MGMYKPRQCSSHAKKPLPCSESELSCDFAWRGLSSLREASALHAGVWGLSATAGKSGGLREISEVSSLQRPGPTLKAISITVDGFGKKQDSPGLLCRLIMNRRSRSSTTVWRCGRSSNYSSHGCLPCLCSVFC